MFLILAIDAIVIITLISVTKRGGVESALPYFAFFVTLIPEECRIKLPYLFDLYTHRLALIVLLILFLSTKKRSFIRLLPFRSLIVAHIAWVLLTTLTSIVVMVSVKQLLAQLLEYYVVFNIFCKTITNVRTVTRIAFAMTAAVVIACVFGLIEIYSKWTVLSLFPTDLQTTYGTGDPIYVELLDRGLRVRSTFPHPILFGGAISMVIPINLYLLTVAKSRFERAFLSSSLVLMFWNLYKTTSRGPWLATAISLSLLLLVSERKIRQWIMAIASLGILAVIVRPGVLETIWNSYLATLNPDTQMGASFHYRPALFNAVTTTLNENPIRALVGFGLGSFREKGLVIVLPKIQTHRWYTCDSAWILFMYETGYVGFLIIAALLVKPAIVALQGYRKLPRPDRYFSLTCFSSFLSFFVVMVSVAVYGWGQNGYMFWLLAAMTVSYVALKKRGHNYRRQQSKHGEVNTKPEEERQALQQAWREAYGQ